MWACGSDDDGGPDGSGGASAGAAGHTGGSAGKAQGGGAGKAEGGSAGKAQGGGSNGGHDNAGEGGMPNVAGSGGDNVGGDNAGGSGGDSAGGSAGDGSDGGAAGGPSAPTVEENCAAICSAQSTLSCSFGANCVTGCVVLAKDTQGGATDDIPDYEKMIACEAKFLTTVANYECSDQGAGIPKMPAPKAGTQCEPSICAWECADMTGSADGTIVARCNCP